MKEEMEQWKIRKRKSHQDYEYGLDNRQVVAKRQAGELRETNWIAYGQAQLGTFGVC